MITDKPGPLVSPAGKVPDRGWRRLLCQGENLLVVISLAAMMLLPVIEILSRAIFKTGLSGSSAIVQHLTLIVGMLGGAIAARDGRLLALSPVQTLLKGKAKISAQIFSGGFAAAISFFLCFASLQYVKAVKPLGKILVYGIPVWVIQLVLPIGFGLVAVRLVWRAAEEWKGRLITLAVACLVAGLAVWAPGSPEKWLVPALIFL